MRKKDQVRQHTSLAPYTVAPNTTRLAESSAPQKENPGAAAVDACRGTGTSTTPHLVTRSPHLHPNP
eukprot:scaffold13669_cov94-Isochrysis_galbana.AAC.3